MRVKNKYVKIQKRISFLESKINNITNHSNSNQGLNF